MADKGTVIVTSTGFPDGLLRGTIAWTSDGDGNATATTTRIRGTIERITFVPGSGDDKPTDNYAATLLDDDGVDALRGKGAALSDTTVSNICTTDSSPVLPYPTSGALDLSVSGAGAANSGTIRLFVRR